ncbi:hypothetical protein WAI453_007051 [Rhynchosporium graminicola]
MKRSNTTSALDVNIVLPYAAFDLVANLSLAQNATRYFPLTRAVNNTQNVLGRALLQEAYLIADYERSQFSIHRMKWDTNGESDIRIILPQLATKRRQKLPTAIIVAICVCGALFCTLCDHFTSPPSKAQSFETGYIQCEKDEPIIDKPLPPNPASTASTFKSYLDARGSQRTSPESSVLLVRGTTLRLRAFQEPVDCSDTEEVHELPADEPVSGEVSGSPVEVKLQQTIDSILEQHNKERMEGREITVGERGHKTIRHVGAAPPAV